VIDFWVLETLGGGRAYIVRAGAEKPLSSLRPVSVTEAVSELGNWLRDSASRRRLFEVYAEIRQADLGCLERRARSEIDPFLQRDLELALELGDLVVLEEVLPAGGGVRLPPSASPPRPSTTGPSTPKLPPLRPNESLDDLWIRLDIPPRDAAASADRLEVASTDGAYRQQRAVAGDHVPNDEASVDIEFTDLFTDRRYDLKVFRPDRAPYFVFRNVAYSSLGAARARPTTRVAQAPDDPSPPDVAGVDGPLDVPAQPARRPREVLA
jgi:hypothetical protein